MIISKVLIKILRKIKNKLLEFEYFSNLDKKMLFLRMKKQHEMLLKKMKGKKRVRVVFLVIHKSVWKVDTVFQKMLEDDFFDPVILVCPYTFYGDDRMWADMQECLEYFNMKKYPTYSSYNHVKNYWTKLEELNPDIVFFTNPHNLTRKEYYEDAYLNYLSCYVPYHHEVGSFGNNNEQHNQLFHNAMWKIFAAHEDSFLLAKKTSQSKAKNIEVTGFPAMETLVNRKIKKIHHNQWKTNDGRKKIIWAPHHLISENINQGNFLEYADFFIELAIKYSDKVVWAFKPHPILKEKLLNHPQWGGERTQDYYNFWREKEFSQLETGDYEDLFISSDSMIHDCGSFLAEYLYVEKPVMYILNEKHNGQFFNTFGLKALAACHIARTKEDINNFLLDLINESLCSTNESKNGFFDRYIENYFSFKLPSDFIIEKIKHSIRNED